MREFSPLPSLSSRILASLCLFALAATMISCSSDNEDEIYPPIVTEMAMAFSDSEGRMTHFTTDSGQTYQAANEVTGMDKNETLRAMLGYVVTEEGKARLYSARHVPVLPLYKAKSNKKHDPTGIVSGWMGGGFLNFHLQPKTKGGKQAWAFTSDSTSTNPLGGTTHHLSLYHDQKEDTIAYSSDFYISISLDSIASAYLPTDSITFTIYDQKGPQTWYFGNLK